MGINPTRSNSKVLLIGPSSCRNLKLSAVLKETLKNNNKGKAETEMVVTFKNGMNDYYVVVSSGNIDIS